FFFSSRRRHTRFSRDWSSDVCSSDLEELSFVEFRPGTAELTEASVRRLETIAKALTERPALKLEVAGRVDPDAERDAIRRERLRSEERRVGKEGRARWAQEEEEGGRE